MLIKLFLFFITYFYNILFKTNQQVDWNIDGTDYNLITIKETEERGFLLYHPNKNNPKPLPLWILLHGQSTNAKIFAEQSDFFMVAEEKEIIAVFAEGHCYEEIESMCCWNTGHLKGLTIADWGLHDMDFLDELITRLISTYDVSEIIMTGFSAGAFMSYTYAINTTVHEVFAILPVAGHIGGTGSIWQPPVEKYDPNKFGVQSDHRPHVIGIIGGEDPIVTEDGGLTFEKRDDLSLKDDMYFWMDANDCVNKHTSLTYYDMEDQVKLTYYGEDCQKLVASVIVEDAVHTIKSYDKQFLNIEQKESFTKYSKTLSEFLVNLVEYVIKKVSLPSTDPDPEPPTDGDYPFWSLIFPNNGYHNRCCCIFTLMITLIIKILF